MVRRHAGPSIPGCGEENHWPISDPIFAKESNFILLVLLAT